MVGFAPPPNPVTLVPFKGRCQIRSKLLQVIGPDRSPFPPPSAQGLWAGRQMATPRPQSGRSCGASTPATHRNVCSRRRPDCTTAQEPRRVPASCSGSPGTLNWLTPGRTSWPSMARCLLLRSAKPVATRLQREHQWSAQTVLPQGNRLVGILAGSFEQSGPAAKRAATQNACIRNASRKI